LEINALRHLSTRCHDLGQALKRGAHIAASATASSLSDEAETLADLQKAFSSGDWRHISVARCRASWPVHLDDKQTRPFLTAPITLGDADPVVEAAYNRWRHHRPRWISTHVNGSRIK
jgi:hypothetical protein